MSKQANKTAPLGTKENPYNNTTLSRADYEANKKNYAGVYFKTGGDSDEGEVFQFKADGSTGRPGNLFGTGHSKGAGTGTGKKNFPALINNNNFSPAILNGETPEEHAAKVARFELGREIISKVASKITVKTAATKGGETFVPLTEAELCLATKGMKQKEIIAFVSNPSNMKRKVIVEASDGETVTLDKLREGVALAPGEEAKVMETLLSAVQTAIRACPVQ